MRKINISKEQYRSLADIDDVNRYSPSEYVRKTEEDFFKKECYMKTLKEYKEYLNKRGYKNEGGAYAFLNGVLTSIIFSKGEREVDLSLEYEDDYFNELMNSDKDGEYEPDFSRINVTSAHIKSSYVNAPEFLSGESNGIILTSDSENNIGRVHNLSLFEKCLDMSEKSELDQTIDILSKFLPTINEFKDRIDPVLTKNEYYVYYNSLFSVNEERSDTNIEICYRNTGSSEVSYFMDCITGEIEISIYLTAIKYAKKYHNVSDVDIEELEKKLKEENVEYDRFLQILEEEEKKRYADRIIEDGKDYFY